MFSKGRVILICCSLSPNWLGNINKTIHAHQKIQQLVAAASVGLNGRAGDIAIRAKNATIAFKWLQYCFAVFAFVKKLARVFEHGFFFRKPAGRAGNC